MKFKFKKSKKVEKNLINFKIISTFNIKLSNGKLENLKASGREPRQGTPQKYIWFYVKKTTRKVKREKRNNTRVNMSSMLMLLKLTPKFQHSPRKPTC